MTPDVAKWVPYLLALVAIFAVWRRLRRSFGRQPITPVRMAIRIALLSFVACAMLPLALKSRDFLWAEIAGAAGAPLTG